MMQNAKFLHQILMRIALLPNSVLLDYFIFFTTTKNNIDVGCTEAKQNNNSVQLFVPLW